LAGVYAARASHDMNDPLYRAQERHRALERALSLDPQSAEAHVRMGRLHVAFGRPDAARASFETAYEYGPDDPTVLATLSVRAMIGGRADEAVQLARRCVEAEPLSAVHRANYARLLLAMGAAEPAREQLVLAMQLSPRLVELHGEVARAFMLQDRLAEARTSVLSMPAGPLRDQLQVLLESGPEAAVSEARLQDDESWLSLFLRAEIEAHRGAIDSAFALLDQAREGWIRTQVGASGSPAVFAMELAVSPLLRTLHGDDRWHALMLDVATHLA
jgi:tetratricopeptide (TPR) repeat protein